jgi:hypothetical protein
MELKTFEFSGVCAKGRFVARQFMIQKCMS